MKVFISHSSQDKDLAEALILLLRSALSLSEQDIRCSSVDGYRLPVGANTDEKIRREVYECKVLVGLLTPASISSPYVLFELGARWGAGMDIAPVVCRGAHVGMLRGPLTSLNSLEGSIEAQVHQLIFDIARMLDVGMASPASYHKHIDQFVRESRIESHTVRNSQRVSTPLRLRSAYLLGCGLGNRLAILPLGEGAHNEFREFLEALEKLKITGPVVDGLRVFAGENSPLSAAGDLPVDSDPVNASREFQRRFPNERPVLEALETVSGLLSAIEEDISSELSNFEVTYYRLGNLLYSLAMRRMVLVASENESGEDGLDDNGAGRGELLALASLIEIMSLPAFIQDRLRDFVRLASDPSTDAGRVLTEANTVSIAVSSLLDVLANDIPIKGERALKSQ